MQQMRDDRDFEAVWETEDFESRHRSDERRRRARDARRKKRQRQIVLVRTIVFCMAAVLCLALGAGMWTLGSYIWRLGKASETKEANLLETKLIQENHSEKPEMTEAFLTPNEYSRPGDELPEVTELFVHYTANAGTSAAQNRSYFENLGVTKETSASSHFIIGYEGEIVQCLPLSEIGYAVKEHNFNSISIECCYLDENGKFTDATRKSLIRLLGWLMREYELGPSAVKRHYDAGGKPCPIYYVKHEDEWGQLLEEVKTYIEAP